MKRWKLVAACGLIALCVVSSSPVVALACAVGVLALAGREAAE